MSDATSGGETVSLRLPTGEHELKVVHPVEGAPGIELGKLLASTGYITLDPGFVNTGAASSAITYIDGDEGILRYRGYPIEQLAAKSTFIEVSYLLIYGELPTPTQLEDFTGKIQRHTLLHEDLKAFFGGFPRDAHPMPVLSSAVSALSTFYQDSLNPFDEPNVELSTIRLLAKVPTLAAYAYKKAKALDLLFILHADHEQNCSTSTVRLVGSSEANLFASVSAGINALFGPLHGGANAAVLDMLEDIKNDGGDVQNFVNRVKNKEKGVKLMGFGHRVYKNYDPRAKIIKNTADEILGKLAGGDQLLDIAKKLEETALSDDYFVERKLYPNVDFYTGLIYRALGFPTKYFTVLFALGRLPGWIAHWREMIQDPATKIGRPRQIYTGEKARDYVGIGER